MGPVTAPAHGPQTRWTDWSGPSRASQPVHAGLWPGAGAPPGYKVTGLVPLPKRGPIPLTRPKAVARRSLMPGPICRLKGAERSRLPCAWPARAGGPPIEARRRPLLMLKTAPRGPVVWPGPACANPQVHRCRPPRGRLPIRKRDVTKYRRAAVEREAVKAAAGEAGRAEREPACPSRAVRAQRA